MQPDSQCYNLEGGSLVLLVVEYIILATHLLGSWQFKSRMRHTACFGVLLWKGVNVCLQCFGTANRWPMTGWSYFVLSATFYMPMMLNFFLFCVIWIYYLSSLVSAGISMPAEARKTWQQLSSSDETSLPYWPGLVCVLNFISRSYLFNLPRWCSRSLHTGWWIGPENGLFQCKKLCRFEMFDWMLIIVCTCSCSMCLSCHGFGVVSMQCLSGIVIGLTWFLAGYNYFCTVVYWPSVSLYSWDRSVVRKYEEGA